MGCTHFTPYVLGPSGVPEVTDEVLARENPELAVLSAMAHGRDAESDASDRDRNRGAKGEQSGSTRIATSIYLDLIMSSLGEAASEALKTMATQKYEFQSDFAKHYIALGRAEGEARGKERKAKPSAVRRSSCSC